MRWDSGQLAALAAVVAEGSFEEAAHALHVSPSAVSQRIKALEHAVGGVLVRRTRPVQVTEHGRPLLRLARQVALLGEETARELGGSGTPVGADPGTPSATPPITVPLAVNADSLATWVLPALTRVDGVCFDLRREDQDRTADLLREGLVMAAITAQATPVQGCTSTRLGVMRYLPVASPAFRDRWFGDGVTPEALTRAPVLVFDRDDALQDRWLRRRTRRRLAPPRHHVPGSAEFLDAIRLGLGWGVLPDLQVEPWLGSGSLVRLEPTGGMDVALYLQQWSVTSVTLARVTGALRAAAAEALHTPARRASTGRA